MSFCDIHYVRQQLCNLQYFLYFHCQFDAYVCPVYFIRDDEKQLRYFLKMQGNLLALRFIPLGALISILIVVILSGVQWLLYDMAIVLLSGFLILLLSSSL